MPVYNLQLMLPEILIDQLEKVANLEQSPPSVIVQGLIQDHMGRLFAKISRAPTSRIVLPGNGNAIPEELDDDDKTPVGIEPSKEELEAEAIKMRLLIEALQTAAYTIAQERDVALGELDAALRRISILESTLKQLRSELELFQALS